MKTALYNRHCALGAKIVEFSGWQMPIQYQGIIPEHHTVREAVGIFDVSHMGRVLVQGRDAEKFLDYLSTNTIAGKKDFSATYTVWCLETGGCVDDVIIYKQSAEHFFVVVNAGNRQKDLEHLKHYAQGFDVLIQDRYAEDGIIAIQGPLATAVVGQIFEEAHTLKPMHFATISYCGEPIVLSATGYTGSGGFEIYAPHAIIVELWDRLLLLGKLHGIAPIGLGARDTLRLEMGYALYGHELSEQIAASESVSAWTIKWNKSDFLGKTALSTLEQSLEKRSEYGIMLLEPGIARADYEIFQGEKVIGKVLSGTLSPTLNKAIAIVMVKAKLQEGALVKVQIRQHRVNAQVVKLPFLPAKIS